MLDSETLEELANLRFAATRFEQLFHGLPLACIGMDSGGTIFEWNRAGEKLIGLDSTSLFLSSAFTVLCPDEAHRNKLYEMLQGMANGQSYESFEWVFSQPGGPTSYLLCSMLPKPGPNGELVGATWAGIDMTAKKAYEMQIETQLRQIHEYSLQIERSKSELEDANRRLEALASTDGLTGLANHRSFFEALRFLFTKPKKIASIIMLDVDNFKTYNDTYGHPEGDSVLRLVSKSLLSVSREGDTVARYGGEEFVVLLPGASSEVAQRVAERMRAAIEDQAWPLRAVCASFGVATRSDNSTPELLLAEADAALYVSKRDGKNRVTVARIPFQELEAA